MMYKPLYCFAWLTGIFGVAGAVIFIRFLVYYFNGSGAGHIQSLILASMLIIIAAMCGVIGLLGDVIAANRKLLEEIQFELRKMDYGPGHEEMKTNEDEEE